MEVDDQKLNLEKHSLRPMKCELNNLSKPDGSAFLTMGKFLNSVFKIILILNYLQRKNRERFFILETKWQHKIQINYIIFVQIIIPEVQ